MKEAELDSYYTDMLGWLGESVTYRSGAWSSTITAHRASIMPVVYGLDHAGAFDADTVEWRFLLADLDGREPAWGDTITDAAGNGWALCGGAGKRAIWRYLDSRNVGIGVAAVKRSSA